MRSKIFVLFALMMAVALAQTTVLYPIHPFEIDGEGFVHFEAVAGYIHEGVMYCHDTSVTVYAAEKEYVLDKMLDCKFTKEVMITTPGEYNVTFVADFPYDPREEWTGNLTIEDKPISSLIIYSPKENAVYKPNDLVYIEAVGVRKNSIIQDAEMLAKLVDGDDVAVKSMYLEQDHIGAFKGNMKMDVDEGDYTLILTLTKGELVSWKEVPITISSEPIDVVPGLAAQIKILYPESGRNYDLNTTVQFEIEFIDANSLIIDDAQMEMFIFSEGELVDRIAMDEQAYTYRQGYFFDTPGRYEVKFSGEKGQIEAENSVFITIGNATQIAEEADFTVDILVPQSNVYAVGSSLLMRARVRYDQMPVTDAIVELDFMGQTILMDYDAYGEYTYVTPNIGIQDTYTVEVLASYQGMLAKDTVEFMISDHFLNISLIEPSSPEVIVMEAGEPLDLHVDVFDETGDIVAGAEVIAEILEPRGRMVETQIFQDPVSGKYKTVVYPNEPGTYELTVTASKSGYVTDIKEFTYEISFPEKQWLPASINYETLLLIILGLAILILVAGFLKFIF